MKLVGHHGARLFLAFVCWVSAPVAFAGGNYLFISSASPSDAAVYYSKLLTAAEQARGMHMSMRRLTKSGQVGHPLGIATDSLRRLLYVADREQKAVLAFRISHAWSQRRLVVEDPVVVMPGV